MTMSPTDLSEFAVQDQDYPDDQLCLTSDYSYWGSGHTARRYHPRYLLELLSNPTLAQPDTVSPRPYLASCLNRTPRLHRAWLFLKLIQQPWFDRCLYSFGNIPPRFDQLIADSIDQLRVGLTAEEFDAVANYIPTGIKLPNEPEADNLYYTSNASLAHSLCMVDIVTESDVTVPFISEKAWKPIVSGQLFLILGPMGIVAHLRATGVDVFDDVFDHGYDQEPDVHVRIDKILKNVLLVTDQVWQATHERRLKNMQLVQSDQYIQLLKD